MTERLDEVGSDGRLVAPAPPRSTSLIDDLVRPTTEVARVIAAVAEGDLSQQMALEIAGQPVKGEFLRIGTTVNTMVDQLSSFADEVTRVAREVGTEGKLGGQAQVRGVSGVWRDLTESVNSMAGNLTSQVRNIAQVTTAVAQGDLTPEDHRRRPGRDPRAQEHRQHDGRPAVVVRRRGDPRGPRGRHRGPARRSGPGARRVRHLARPHRLGELDGRPTSPTRSATSPRSRPRSPAAT